METLRLTQGVPLKKRYPVTDARMMEKRSSRDLPQQHETPTTPPGWRSLVLGFLMGLGFSAMAAYFNARGPENAADARKRQPASGSVTVVNDLSLEGAEQ